MRLYSNRTERLYLNHSEREAFRNEAVQQGQETVLLCLVLFYTGCRLSEALNLRPIDIQQDEGIVAIRSLKKRKAVHIRELPVPACLTERFVDIRGNSDEPMFTFDRTTAWRRVKLVMEVAGIQGIHATPKGLRHSFGMSCAYHGIPITLCQKWMGHADISTTAIYYQIVGKEERELACRLW